MMLVDDYILLQQVSQGDQEALKQLYSRYRLRIYSYLWPLLSRNHAWTEELVQDVFLAVWRSAASYRAEASVSSWIFRIAHHLAMNAARNRSRRPEGHLIDTSHLPGEEVESEPDYLIAASHEEAVIRRMELADALGGLSIKHREVLELICFQGFSLTEVSQILEIPPGTVKSRLSYARKALFTLMHTPEQEQEIQP